MLTLYIVSVYLVTYIFQVLRIDCIAAYLPLKLYNHHIYPSLWCGTILCDREVSLCLADTVRWVRWRWTQTQIASFA